MIMVRMKGGLGNQMFEYALGRALALRRGVPLKLDRSDYRSAPGRQFALGAFRHAGEIATPAEVRRFRPCSGLLFRAFLKWRAWWPPAARRYFVEPREFGYAPGVWDTPTPVYLDGYWQHARYFSDIAEVVRKDFTWREPARGVNAEVLRQIEAGPAVSIHVRRGDYVENPAIGAFHGVCGLDYYRAAIRQMRDLLPDPAFFVFSDDPAWLAAEFPRDGRITLVTHNSGAQAAEDLRLLAACRHHIIANSSFSWWGAWLSAQPGQLVVAPRAWVRQPGVNCQGLYRPEWITL